MPRLNKDDIYLHNKINKALSEFSETNDSNKLKIIFDNIVFEFKESVNVTSAGLEIYFKNCFISGSRVDITLEEMERNKNSLVFENCKINSDLYIKDSKIEYLTFKNVIIESPQFHIASNKIKTFYIEGKHNNFNKINSLILNNNIIENDVIINFNTLQSLLIHSTSVLNYSTLNHNKIERLEIKNSVFQKKIDIIKNTLGNYSIIHYTSFAQIKSLNSNFGSTIEFKQVQFKEIVEFKDLQSNKTTFRFINCDFEKDTYFDNSEINLLEFSSVIFKGITSFQLVKISTEIQFKTTYFEKIGFFEGVKIGSLKSLDINTVRTIKGQLQKSESKIEYLKYNALEQRQYLKKLPKWSSEYYILKLNGISNDFGRNWFKGVLFTLMISAFFFLLIIITNSFFPSKFPLKFDKNLPFLNHSTIIAMFKL